jgi:hypothetical protein
MVVSSSQYSLPCLQELPDLWMHGAPPVFGIHYRTPCHEEEFC